MTLCTEAGILVFDMFDMSSPTCSRAEKGAWHLVWSDLGVLRRRRAGMVFKGRKRVFKGADGRGW